MRSRAVDRVPSKDSFSSSVARPRTFDRLTLSERQNGVLEDERMIMKAVVLIDLGRRVAWGAWNITRTESENQDLESAHYAGK